MSPDLKPNQGFQAKDYESGLFAFVNNYLTNQLEDLKAQDYGSETQVAYSGNEIIITRLGWQVFEVNDQTGPVFIAKKKFSTVGEYFPKQEVSLELEDKYLPKLYGKASDWIFYEKLEGVEDMEERMEKDPEFLSSYSQSVCKLMEEAAFKGFALNDIIFCYGVNCIANPKTGEVRLIESDSFDFYPYLKPHELIMQQLITELGDARYRYLNEGYRSQSDFVFNLLRYFVALLGRENLFIRAQKLSPQNPNYRRLFRLKEDRDLTDEEYSKILEESTKGINHDLFLHDDEWMYPQKISDALVDAVKNDDRDTFSRLLKNQDPVTLIEDRNDHRYAPVVLPDVQIRDPRFIPTH